MFEAVQGKYYLKRQRLYPGAFNSIRFGQLRTGLISKAVGRLLKRYQEEKKYFLHTFFTKGTYKHHINVVIYTCPKGQGKSPKYSNAKRWSRTERKEKKQNEEK